MSGDPPSEPPEDGEGDDREPEEGPDRPTDETADPDQSDSGPEESDSSAEEEEEREASDPEEPTDDASLEDASEDASPEETSEADEEFSEAERDAADDDDSGGEEEYEYAPPDERSEDEDASQKEEEEKEEEEEEEEEEGVGADQESSDEAGGDDEAASSDETDADEDESPERDREEDTGDGEGKEDEEDEDEDEGEDEEDVGEEGDDADEETSDAEETLGEDEEEIETGPNTSVEMHDDTTPIERKTGPASDTEQPLADHIEEMIKRLAVVVIIAGAVSLLAFPFGEDFIIFLWYSVLPTDISQPHVYHPLELVMTQLKAASLLGLVLALPVFVYETYAFMRPGLYPHERRYYLAAVPTSLVLASVGLLFGYFLVLPAVMTYFLYYSRDVVDIAFALGQTFDLMLILLGYLAIVFQIPLFIMLAIMMGLTTRTWLENRRLIFWGAFLGISFLFSPDPTGMAPIIVAATMVGLFEGTLLLLRWTGR